MTTRFHGLHAALLWLTWKSSSGTGGILTTVSITNDEPTTADIYWGAAEAPGYNVVFAPHSSENIGIYNVPSSKFTTFSIADDMVVDTKFMGAATVPDGRVVFAPYAAVHVGVFDLPYSTFKLISIASKVASTTKHFSGAVSLGDGRVLMVPSQSTDLAIYDILTDDIQTFSVGGSTGEGKYQGGALYAGKVYMAPADAEHIGIFDITSNSFTQESVSSITGTQSNKFCGVAITSTGKAVFAPDRHTISGAKVLIYDIATSALTEIDLNTHLIGTWSSSRFFGAVVTASDKVVLVPHRAESAVVIDTASETYIAVPMPGNDNGKFQEGTAAPGGKVLFAAGDTQWIGVFLEPPGATYGGCLDVDTTAGLWSTDGIANKEVGECSALAIAQSKPYFLMGNPSGSDSDGTCLLSDTLPAAVNPKSECSHSFAPGGETPNMVALIGSATRAAVYTVFVTTTSTTTTTSTSTSSTSTSTTNTTTVTPEVIMVDNGGGGTGAVIILSIVTAILFIIGAPLAYFQYKRRGPRFDKKALKYPYELPEEMMDPENEESLFSKILSIEYLLNPPDPITFEDADTVKFALKKLSEAIGDPRAFFPEVFIIAAMGKRGDDCERAGPGLFYAAALLKLCFGHGVPCFSTFLVPDRDEHHHKGVAHRLSMAATSLANLTHVHANSPTDPHSCMMTRLTDRDCLCKVVIIVETPELYEDQKCLEQINAALMVSVRSQEDICVIPLRFNENVVAAEDRWECVKWAHNKKLDKKLALANEALDCSNPIPQSGTIPQSAKHLMTMLQILAGKQRRMVNWTPTHSPWETADHDAGWVADWFSDVGFEPPPTREDSDSDEEESPKKVKSKGIMGMFTGRRSISEKKHLATIGENDLDESEESRSKSKRGTNSVKSALSINPFGSAKKTNKQKSVGFKNIDEEPKGKKRGPSVWGGLFGGGKKDDPTKVPEEVVNIEEGQEDNEKNGEGASPKAGMFGALFTTKPEAPKKKEEPAPPKKGFMGGMFGGIGSAFGYGSEKPEDPEPELVAEESSGNLVILVGADMPNEDSEANGDNEVEDMSWMDVDEKDPDVKEWRQATMKVLDFGGPKKAATMNPSKTLPVKKLKAPGTSPGTVGKSQSSDGVVPKKKSGAKSKAKAMPKGAGSAPLSVKAKAQPKKVAPEVAPERLGSTTSSPDTNAGTASTGTIGEAMQGEEMNFGDLGSMFADAPSAVSAKKKAAKSKAKSKAASPSM